MNDHAPVDTFEKEVSNVGALHSFFFWFLTVPNPCGTAYAVGGGSLATALSAGEGVKKKIELSDEQRSKETSTGVRHVPSFYFRRN